MNTSGPSAEAWAPARTGCNTLGTRRARTGDMGARMRALDWSHTAVGTVEGWPQSLRTAVSILLNSRFPMMIHHGFVEEAYFTLSHSPIRDESGGIMWRRI